MSNSGAWRSPGSVAADTLWRLCRGKWKSIDVPLDESLGKQHGLLFDLCWIPLLRHPSRLAIWTTLPRCIMPDCRCCYTIHIAAYNGNHRSPSTFHVALFHWITRKPMAPQTKHLVPSQKNHSCKILSDVMSFDYIWLRYRMILISYWFLLDIIISY